MSRPIEHPKDNVHPDHYHRFPIEPIRFIVENKLDWFQGNVLKYTCRHDAKNGLEDIDKAVRYLEMYKLYLSGGTNWWVKPGTRNTPDPLLVADLMQSDQLHLPFPVRAP